MTEKVTEKNISINLTPFIAIIIIIMFGIVMCNIINHSAQTDIEKEKTKQLELQLQIEQQKGDE